MGRGEEVGHEGSWMRDQESVTWGGNQKVKLGKGRHEYGTFNGGTVTGEDRYKQGTLTVNGKQLGIIPSQRPVMKNLQILCVEKPKVMWKVFSLSFCE